MLIPCPECSHMISDKATSCPNCGCQLQPPTQEKQEYLCCPKCHSRELHPERRGFSTGQAVVGGLVFGPLGILAGNVGASEEKLICIKCGNRFNVGSAFIEKVGEQADELELKVAELLRSGKNAEAGILYQNTTHAGFGEILPYLQKVAKKYGITLRR